MHFNLEDSRLDLAVLQDLGKHASSDVANTNVAYEALSHELLHRLVGHLISDTLSKLHTRLGAGRVEEPLWWVSGLDRHKFLSDGEVDQI